MSSFSQQLVSRRPPQLPIFSLYDIFPLQVHHQYIVLAPFSSRLVFVVAKLTLVRSMDVVWLCNDSSPSA
jgi:hypothetical protein